MGCNEGKRSIKNEKEQGFNALSSLYRAHSDPVCPIRSVRQNCSSHSLAHESDPHYDQRDQQIYVQS